MIIQTILQFKYFGMIILVKNIRQPHRPHRHKLCCLCHHHLSSFFALRKNFLLKAHFLLCAKTFCLSSFFTLRKNFLLKLIFYSAPSFLLKGIFTYAHFLLCAKTPC